MPDQPTLFHNRATGRTETEQIYGERWLRWLYGKNPAGRLALALLVRRAVFSKWMGWHMNSARSARKILPFIVRYGIDAGECAQNPLLYKSFNAFFSRALKPGARPVAEPDNPRLAVLPADGRHLVFPNLAETGGIYAKGARFTAAELLGSDADAARYENGSMLISRLCPTDYHRFHFPAGGVPGEPRLVNGALFSVHPIALKKNIRYLVQNKRVVTLLRTEAFGQVAIVAIGATSVGGIQNLFAGNHPVRKGDLMGLFAFGGSCVITLFEPGRVRFCDDLLAQSANRMETYSKTGAPLGEAVG
jgi:phosphatidylserine decarboxylase